MSNEFSYERITEYLDKRFLFLFNKITGLCDSFAPKLIHCFDAKKEGNLFIKADGKVSLGHYSSSEDVIKLNLDDIRKHVNTLFCPLISKMHYKDSSVLLAELVLIHELFHVKQYKIDKVCFSDCNDNEKVILEKEADDLATQFFLENIDENIPKDEITEIITYYKNLREKVLITSFS